MEGASPTKTPAPVAIDINISGLTLDGDDANGDGLGTITLDHDADTVYPGKGARTRVTAGGFGLTARVQRSMSPRPSLTTGLVEHT